MESLSSAGYPCPCCGYVVHDEPPGSYLICRICWWEDDPGQLRNPLVDGGANKMSLVDAQKSFAEIGASDRAMVARSTSPRPDDVRDPGWRPVNIERDRLLVPLPDPSFWPEDRTTFYWWRATYWRHAH